MPLQFGHLERVTLGVIYAPKVAIGLSPGFQPWEPSPERRALKGRRIEHPNNAAKVSNFRTSQLRTLFCEAIGASFISLASRPFRANPLLSDSQG